ncbi:unnamed protein product [Haemonchus placei]|uniref:RRM domain-containing protein n=1 Tax=Haemonchus placei TaxID=6290 RepID=A0A0N4W2U2_HAEPC|nr:unnamed protein product [Haemonchus placei]
MAFPPTDNSGTGIGTKLNGSGTKSISTSTHANISASAEFNNSESSQSLESLSSPVVCDSGLDEDEEFEKEMCLMLTGNHPQTTYSRKVFLGGLPPYTDPDDLQRFFATFGEVEIVWPLTENTDSDQEGIVYGYAFAVFASADSVVNLVNKCAQINGKFSISVPVGGTRHVSIHVRVWLNRNTKYFSENGSDFMDKLTKNAIFVGGLPRTVTAKELFDLMSLTFGDVIMTQIEVELETDYPKGAGCVVFRDRDSFLVAIARRFAGFKFTECFKKVELKPYLIRFTQCDVCQKSRARNFCPQLRCLKYMCESCWQHAHVDLDNNSEHLPMVRSPPVRARFTTNNPLMQKEREASIGYPLQSQNNTIENSEKAEVHARNLYRLVNSLPITPISLLESMSEPHRDWNTDCGMFDSRGPPPHSEARDFTGTIQPSPRRSSSRKSTSEARHDSHRTNQRMYWNKCYTRGSTHAPRSQFSHNSYYAKDYNAPDRGYGSIDWNGSYGDTVNFYPTASTAYCDSWSERISALANSSFSRPVLMSPYRLNHFVRARTSFSPTIRRPNQRPTSAQAQKSTNDYNDTTKDLNDNVALLVSQFQLF